jgi:methyltransferase (TIGR00027 family)
VPPSVTGRSAVTGTALWIAAARARESERPERLFDDPWAAALAGPRGRADLVDRERGSGRENAFLPVRTRYADDVVLSASWAVQVVLLGAGMDTRAYRLPLASGTTVFEVDHPETFVAKGAVLAGVEPRCGRREVGADLSADWAPALLRAGFDPDRPTLWLAEGLLFYLASDAVDALLTTAVGLSRARTRLVADTFGTGLLRLPSMAPLIEARTAAGTPLPFCTDDPQTLFTACGWETVSVVQPGQSSANYGRLGQLPTPWDGGADPTMRTHLVTADRSAR